MFYISKDFSGTDIYHSDTKNALEPTANVTKIFCLLKTVFKCRKNFHDKLLVRSQFFSQFVEKIEKFILSLPKQHNKMLKMRSKMMKTRKKAKQSSSKKFPGKNFREFFESRES